MSIYKRASCGFYSVHTEHSVYSKELAVGSEADLMASVDGARMVGFCA